MEAIGKTKCPICLHKTKWQNERCGHCGAVRDGYIIKYEDGEKEIACIGGLVTTTYSGAFSTRNYIWAIIKFYVGNLAKGKFYHWQDGCLSPMPVDFDEEVI